MSEIFLETEDGTMCSLSNKFNAVPLLRAKIYDLNVDIDTLSIITVIKKHLKYSNYKEVVYESSRQLVILIEDSCKNKNYVTIRTIEKEK